MGQRNIFVQAQFLDIAQVRLWDDDNFQFISLFCNKFHHGSHFIMINIELSYKLISPDDVCYGMVLIAYF